MTKKNLSSDDIAHLGKLSNLQLSDEEIEKYKTQIDETLDYVENLAELDTSHVKETSQITDLQNVTFEDGKKNERSLNLDQATMNAKNKKNGFLVVKKIL